MNAAEAVLPEESVAVMVWSPADAFGGMAIVASKLPTVFVATVEGEVTIALESNFIIMLMLGLKLKPETVTELPRTPASGDSVTVADVVISNKADP
ncbi:MAG: hypothetical protein ACE5J2_07795, partial [Nitrososphaerales archaeon]